ncbi:MAG TPA: TM2 domain-containing protein [Pyrinomonadaceae bacterium]|nr:TM2 domain-containing protein [Pyrinomonadaceae bacterium]
MSRYCTKCGAVNDDTAQYCTNCQAALTSVSGSVGSGGGGYQPMQSVHPGAITDWKALGADKKITAGICAILVGWLGVHKFILGYTTEGVIQLVLGILTCGITNIISIVEGIIYLTKSDEEFVRTYIQNKKGWF